MVEERGHIGGDEVFVLAQADYGRRSIAGGDDLVRFGNRDHDQCKYPGEFLDRLPDGFLQQGTLTVSSLQIVLLNQVGDDFRIGFGGELVAFGDQLFLERKIVFDNAVVHDHDGAGAIAVGMGIFLGGAAMRGPARVSDAVGAVERLEADHFFQVAQFTFGAANLQAFAASGHRDSGRVVPAVLQLSQALNDDGDDLLLAHISHNSAHWRIRSLMIRWGTDGSP